MQVATDPPCASDRDAHCSCYYAGIGKPCCACGSQKFLQWNKPTRYIVGSRSTTKRKNRTKMAEVPKPRVEPVVAVHYEIRCILSNLAKSNPPHIVLDLAYLAHDDGQKALELLDALGGCPHPECEGRLVLHRIVRERIAETKVQ